jgi:bis(5'-nucleosidyl)-tetraphosphatase
MQPEGTQRWQLPKGKIEGGERAEPTALREVEEEGGVKTKIVADLGKITYFFSEEGERVAKQVRFFLMEFTGGSPDSHDHEVEKAEFLEYGKVLKNLSFDNEKEILEKAKKTLEEQERQPSLL